eukprot:11959416-Heterocapsa_arctica.AAC.1
MALTRAADDWTRGGRWVKLDDGWPARRVLARARRRFVELQIDGDTGAEPARVAVPVTSMQGDT